MEGKIMKHGILLALLVTGLAPAGASAQAGPLDRFAPGETPEDDFAMSRPTDLGHLRFGAQLHLDYALNPLVYETTLGDPSSESLAVVEHQLQATLGLSLGLFDRLVVYAGLPVTLLMEGAGDTALMPVGVPVSDGAGLGDAYLGGRVRIYGEEDDPFVLGAQATVTFPTSIDSTYRGDPSLTVHPEVLAELRPGGGARIVIDVGALIREETAGASNLEFHHELTYGVGFAIPAWTDAGDERTHLDVHAQLYGASAFALMGQREGTALEATAGVRFSHASGLVAGLAGGPGLNRGFGSPDLRLVGTVGWATPAESEPRDRDGDGILDDDDRCPDQPEDADGFQDEDGCPDPDNDEDGILDEPDQCPNEPETVNQVDDEDGCPDEVGDLDGDGILDPDDRCPAVREDADGFQDEDGCPDPDNDEDTVPDTEDRCPNEAGVPENGGCPDTDRDGDTVPDRIDNCPDEPGPPDNAGCQREQQVVIQQGQLEILDRVYFRTDRAHIQRRSYPLLMNVAQVINAHPEITQIRVEGHTDSRGSREHNMTLSQQRAEAVVRFLVERGHVDPSRLVARGYGPDRPIVENASTPAEHARNRRVEFHTGSDEIRQQDSGPGADTIDR